MNMIHRARYGFGKGPNNVTFGFFRCINSEIKRHKPDGVYVVCEGRPHHRHEIFPEYKSNRKKEKDDSFFRQVNDIFSILKYMPLTVIRHPNFECDDVIAMLCKSVHPSDSVVICSSDSDFIQLLEMDSVSLWNPVKKKFIEKWPVDYLTWKSLKGDPTDNIAGVKGIGDKGAHKFASDPVLLEKLFESKPEARSDFNKAMTLIRFAELDPTDKLIELNSYEFNEKLLYDKFIQMSFKSITGKAWDGWKNTLESLNESSLQSAS